MDLTEKINYRSNQNRMIPDLMATKLQRFLSSARVTWIVTALF